MFAVPPEQQLERNGAGAEGIPRFLRRLWNLGMTHAGAIRAGYGDGVVAGMTDADHALRRGLYIVPK